MNYCRLVLISLVLVLSCTMPVMGETTYLSEGPEMSAAISGTNEFSPGHDAVISVIVQNRGDVLTVNGPPPLHNEFANIQAGVPVLGKLTFAVISDTITVPPDPRMSSQSGARIRGLNRLPRTGPPVSGGPVHQF